MRRPILIAWLVLPAGLAAQTLTEYAASAAGSSTGAVAGRKLSQGLDKALNKAAAVTQTTAEARQEKKAGQAASAATALPASSARRQRSATRREVAVRFYGPVLPPAPPEREPEPKPTAVQEPFVPTTEDLGAIAEGTSRADVIARLGAPASKVLMADEGKLVETYQYRTKDGAFGRLRLVDGVVSAVK